MLSAVLVLALPTAVDAQTSWTSTSSGLAPIGLPLPPIGLPLAPIGLPPASMEPPSSDQRPGRPDTKPGDGDRGRRDRGDRFKRSIGSGMVYVGGPYWWGYEPPPTAAQPGTIAYEAPVQSSRPPVGRLRLEVEPAEGMQVFVDGEFVGTMDEVGRELDLGEGSRRVELRAPGYEPLVVDVRIVAGRDITYRDQLKALETTPAANSAPLPVHRTLYFIPGCYMGNVPPQEISLPPGCDLSRLVTRTP